MGKVIMSGIVPQLVAPVTGILASDLSVGSIVKLIENGSPVEYLVVNQGKPNDSSLYDDSCDGLWLLRKDLYENRQWHSTNNNAYAASTIHSYLNSTFLSLLGSVEQAAIKQVKIPYVNGTENAAVASGASGLSAKVFLLSGYEVGWTSSTNRIFPEDGACLEYFNGTADTDSKRIAYLDSTATSWWLRSASTASAAVANLVYSTGTYYSYGVCKSQYGIRPALVLPTRAVFDEETLLLKGVF